MQRLEKELYYYKKTSRELKKRLRELEASGAVPHQGIILLELASLLCQYNNDYVVVVNL